MAQTANIKPFRSHVCRTHPNWQNKSVIMLEMDRRMLFIRLPTHLERNEWANRLYPFQMAGGFACLLEPHRYDTQILFHLSKTKVRRKSSFCFVHRLFAHFDARLLYSAQIMVRLSIGRPSEPVLSLCKSISAFSTIPVIYGYKTYK